MLQAARPAGHHRFWLFPACVLPSLGVVLKYSGVTGLMLYLLVATLWISLLLPWAQRQSSRWEGAEQGAPRLAAAVLVLLLAAFLVVYPLSHSGCFGKGTDRADALNISIPRYLKGENPYTVRTFLGNSVTPLPGALVLGSPFWMVFRDAAAQNIIWVFVLFLLFCGAAAVRMDALLIWVTLVFLSPGLLQDVMTGGDFVADAIYCAGSTFLLLRALAQPTGMQDRWRLPLLASVWGLCLCSRPSYLVVMPFVLAYAEKQRGWKVALGVTATALAVFAALVLPIYLPAPADFSPLHLGGKLTGTAHLTLRLEAEAGAAAALLLLAAWMSRRYDLWFVFAAAAVFLALPVPLLLLTTLRQTGHAELATLLYGESSSIFLAVALLSAAGKHGEEQ